MGDNNLFEDKQIDKLYDELLRLAKEGFEEKSEVEWKDLKKAAQDFLKNMDNIHKVFEQKETSRLKAMMQNPLNANKIFDTSKEERTLLLKSKYLLAFSFDAKVKKFFNQLPSKALFVYEFKDDKGKFNLKTEEMDLTKLISLITAEGEIGRLYSSATTLSESDQEKEIVEKRLQEKGQEEHLNHARIAYIGTYNRLQRFFERRKAAGKGIYINQEGKEVNKTHQGGIILWKIQRQWMLGKVANFGDLKEAYATLLMTNHQHDLLTNTLGDAPYYEHELIGKFFEKYIHNVTNKAAIFGEDINFGDAKYQWSVKSYKAQMPSLKQYINAATLIKNSGDEPLGFKEFEKKLYTDEEFRKDFPKERHRNKFEKFGRKSIKSLTHQFVDSVNSSNKNVKIEIPKDYFADFPDDYLT